MAAAFECKITLKASHVREAVKTAADIRRNLPQSTGSPYKELNSPIIYGLLAHSHSWKGQKSQPLDNIETALWESDAKNVEHPIQCIDLITVSDLAHWQSLKFVFLSPVWEHYNEELAKVYGKDGSGISSYACAAIGAERQKDYFTPIAALLAGLFSKLSWTFKDMRGLDWYFRRVNMMGSGEGRRRLWPITIYSEGIRSRVYSGQSSSIVPYDEWQSSFF